MIFLFHQKKKNKLEPKSQYHQGIRKILESFLNNLYRFSNDFPLKKVKIPQDLRSINIVNRLYQNTKPKREGKIWSQEEIDFIDKLLLLNKTRTLYKMLSKFKCSKSELEN